MSSLAAISGARAFERRANESFVLGFIAADDGKKPTNAPEKKAFYPLKCKSTASCSGVFNSKTFFEQLLSDFSIGYALCLLRAPSGVAGNLMVPLPFS